MFFPFAISQFIVFCFLFPHPTKWNERGVGQKAKRDGWVHTSPAISWIFLQASSFYYISLSDKRKCHTHTGKEQKKVFLKKGRVQKLVAQHPNVRAASHSIVEDDGWGRRNQKEEPPAANTSQFRPSCIRKRKKGVEITTGLLINIPF
jgi:hypothetical protein